MPEILTPTLKETYQERGFVLGGPVLSAEQCEHLCEEIERLVRERDSLPEDHRPVRISNLGSDESPVWQIVNIFMASDAFRELVFHQDLTRTAAELSGAKTLRLWHDQIQYKPAGKGGVNYWHQDWPYWPILDRPTQISAWVALDDAGEDNGCMSMTPGSHTWGNTIEWLHQCRKNIPYEDFPTAYEGRVVEKVLCPVPRGHVHFHHGLTWHGSHANRSGRPRRAIALHYMTEETRYKADGGHPMKPYVTVADGEVLAGDAFPVVYPR